MKNKKKMTLKERNREKVSRERKRSRERKCEKRERERKINDKKYILVVKIIHSFKKLTLNY